MISKLQRVVCHLNDRISTVEQMSGIAPPAIIPVTTGTMLLLLLFFATASFETLPFTLFFFTSST
jgi:hypothetical protein